MDKRRQIIVRLLIALLVGTTVCVVATVSAWQVCHMDPWFELGQQWETLHKMRQIESAIDVYRQEMGLPPASFANLEGTEGIYEPIEDGIIRDAWDHPLVYSQEGADYTVRSYGRDGKPGGAGLDRDLLTPTSNIDWFAVGPTLYQYVFEMGTEGVIASFAVSGALAFVLTLALVKPPKLTALGILSAAVKIALTAGVALITAAIMAFSHVPVGH